MALAAPPVVLHAIDALRTGGAEWTVGALVAALAGEGLTRNVVVSATDDDADPALLALLDATADRVELLDARRMADHRFLVGLLSASRPQRPALVHSHLVGASVNGRLAARVLGVPHVTTVHTPPGGAEDSRRRQQADGLTARLSARVVAPSAAVAEAYRRAWHVPARRMAVLPGAAAVRPPRPGARRRVREELGISSAEVLVLAVARLVPAKGIDVLSAAATRLPGHVRVVVAGDGEDRGRLQDAARRAGVLLLGARGDVPDLLDAADVVCLPSRHEALPLSVLEAMRAARPVVASAVGGLPELLEDGAGVLVPPGDAGALAQALTRLADDRALREQIGAAGRGRVQERHDPAEAARAHARLYAALL
jgi:glycosyltransferase involved in cell wall biosynthesis